MAEKDRPNESTPHSDAPKKKKSWLQEFLNPEIDVIDASTGETKKMSPLMLLGAERVTAEDFDRRYGRGYLAGARLHAEAKARAAALAEQKQAYQQAQAYEREMAPLRQNLEGMNAVAQEAAPLIEAARSAVLPLLSLLQQIEAEHGPLLRDLAEQAQRINEQMKAPPVYVPPPRPAARPVVDVIIRYEGDGQFTVDVEGAEVRNVYKISGGGGGEEN